MPNKATSNTNSQVANKETESFIQKFFEDARSKKQEREALYKKAQQKKFEEKKRYDRHTKITEPTQVKLLPFECGKAFNQANAEYQQFIEKLLDVATPGHVKCVNQTLDILQQRMEKISLQQEETRKDLAEVESTLDSLSASQNESAGFALAQGDFNTAKTVESDANEKRQALRLKQDQLSNKLPSFAQAIGLLQLDISVAHDMLENLQRGLSLQAYQVKQQRFNELLSDLKPVYEECLLIAHELNISSEEFSQISELSSLTGLELNRKRELDNLPSNSRFKQSKAAA